MKKIIEITFLKNSISNQINHIINNEFSKLDIDEIVEVKNRINQSICNKIEKMADRALKNGH